MYIISKSNGARAEVKWLMENGKKKISIRIKSENYFFFYSFTQINMLKQILLTIVS